MPPMDNLLALVGPTASGKTAVAVALAEALGGEIISADAVAVYRGLDIGAAKPDAAERARAAFHLIDICDPTDDFTVADFERRANEAIAQIRSRGRLPIVAGCAAQSALTVRKPSDGGESITTAS